VSKVWQDLRLVVGSWDFESCWEGFRMTFAAYMSTDLNPFSVQFSMLTEASVSVSLCRLEEDPTRG
jgi:hypothetical protein